MASLQSSSSLMFSSKRIDSAISVPKLQKAKVSVPKIPKRSNLVEEICLLRDGFPIEKNVTNNTTIHEQSSCSSASIAELYAILEAVADRVEMHKNIGEQRDNWNTLLLNSINMITLTAATMAGVGATGSISAPLLALKLSSTLLFSAATGMLLIMNKIQPSQLVEEQRNATRLFKQLQCKIETILALGSPTKQDVKDAMERVLTLDKAYPLPLLGTMLEKFPQTFEPAIWWPNSQTNKTKAEKLGKQLISGGIRKMEKVNGWNEELEIEMREVIEVIKRKDIEDYERLGKIALKVNKVLAISGPILTGIAALGSAFVGSSNGSWPPIVAMAGGALATIVSTLEHGGQVGMVFEMYRNTAGFFTQLEQSIESTLSESEIDSRENGELFEMKVALKLGRSLSQLRDLARKSSSSRVDHHGTAVDEFASKLF